MTCSPKRSRLPAPFTPPAVPMAGKPVRLRGLSIRAILLDACSLRSRFSVRGSVFGHHQFYARKGRMSFDRFMVYSFVVAAVVVRSRSQEVAHHAVGQEHAFSSQSDGLTVVGE